MFHVSVDQGKNWSIIQGELFKQNDKLILNSTIDGVKNHVNIFCEDDTITIFDNVILLKFN
jgi:hypothetical protein